MTRADVQNAVAAAVDRGELPPGGPSEAAAHGLLDHLPDGYWQRWSEATVDRIRIQASRRGSPGAAGSEGARPGGAPGPAAGLLGAAGPPSPTRPTTNEE